MLAAAALSWSGAALLPVAAHAATAVPPVLPVDLPVKPSAPLTPPAAPAPGPVPGRDVLVSKGVFDAATSTPVKALTTPTRLVYANKDGSRTAVVSAQPTRFKDIAGVWRDLDLSLVPDALLGLHGKATPPGAASLAARSGGQLASVSTPAGAVSVALVGATDTLGVPAGASVRFPRALGKADLTLQATVDGFEESLILPDATAPAAHQLRFTVPAGVTARQTTAGVELLDRTGTVAGRLGNGLAADAATSYAGGGQESEVHSRLVSQQAGSVLVSVELDPAWLADPARVFPVTVDPGFTTATGQGGSNFDTWVGSGYNSSQATSPELRIGTPDGGASVYRSYLHFDLSAGSPPLPIGTAAVSEAHVRLFNLYSFSCNARTVTASAAAGPVDAGTVWANQPGGAAPTTSASFAHGYSSSCAADWDQVDISALAQQWGVGPTGSNTVGAQNFGVMLGANETDSYGYKRFYSGNNSPTSAPQLSITYNNMPTKPANPAPADKAKQASLTPTLSVSAASDADQDPISYYFRVSRAASGEADGTPANVVAESGMQTSTSWTVPVGALRDGVTYFWHVYTYDGKNYGLTSDVVNFRTDLRLGAHGPAPYDSAGPVTVNLATGNVVFAPSLPSVATVGGSLGLSLTYNSQAGPGTDRTGLGRGWTLSSGAAGYSDLAVSADGSVTLTDDTGAVHQFTGTTPLGQARGLKPPDDMPDAVLAYDPTAGSYTLHDEDGGTYVFNQYGQLLTAVSGTDDRHPAAPVMTWAVPAGVPAARLTTVTDPVSQAKLTLHYGYDASTTPTSPDPVCANMALPAGAIAAPPGALCQVDYPDASTAQLFYDSTSKQLARIVNPGGQVWAVHYDPLSRLDQVREPLADEWVRAGGSSGAAARDTAATYTLITYDGTNRAVSVQLADPTPLVTSPDDRPKTTYTYTTPVPAQPGGTPGSTSAQDAGLTAPRTVTFDDALRTLTDTDPTGVTSSSSWFDDDRAVASTDPAGRVSTTVYDSQQRATDSYGPATGSTAAGACFNAGRGGDGKPTGVAGCDSLPPHSHIDYDLDPTGHPVPGLAAVWWPNNSWTGPPTLHSTVAPDTSGTIGFGTGSPTGLGVVDNFSGRFTGSLQVPTAGLWTFTMAADDAGRLYLDNTLVIDRGTGPAGTGTGTFDLTAGPHQIRLDYAEYTGSAGVTLSWQAQSATGPSPIQPYVFTPNYALATGSTSDDGPTTGQAPSLVTTTSYTAPENGLATSSTIDPAGLNLTSSTGYEAPGAGYLRRTSKTLPSGAVSTYSYYGDTATATNPCNPTAPALSQGGRAKTTSNPTPGTTGDTAWTQTSVYDLLGRTVASWWNNETTPTCTSYDAQGRPTSVIGGKGSANPRTVTTNYAVGGDPLTTASTDTASTGSKTITTTTDLLGRITSYTDVYDTTTTTSYDQAGRVTGTSTSTYAQTTTGSTVTRGATTGTRTEAFSYDQDGRLKTQTENGLLLATATYNSTTGELTGVSYANNTNLGTLTRDTAGRQLSATWTFAPTGQSLTDTLIRSRTGRIFQDKTTASNQPVRQWDYTYDTAGRLTHATQHANSTTTHDLSYQFGATPTPITCPTGAVPATQAGKNTNRTGLVDAWTNPTLPAGTAPVTTSTSSCYDNTDRLLATASTASSGTPPGTQTAGYDSHGNTTTLTTSGSNQTLTYDTDDRNTSLADGHGALVSYLRDATNRIVYRSATGTAPGLTTGNQAYSFTSSGDTPDLTLDTSTHTILERTLALPGGVTLTLRPTAPAATNQVWAYPNLHGDIVTTAGPTGDNNNLSYLYDPYGQPQDPTTLALCTDTTNDAVPDTTTGQYDNAWLGQHQRGYEHAGTLALTQMGARVYNPGSGRFLTVDPVEGGSANNYDYVAGDPVDYSDLLGQTMDVASPGGPGGGALLLAGGTIVAVAVVVAAATSVVHFVGHTIHAQHWHNTDKRSYGAWIDKQPRVKPKTGRARWVTGTGAKKRIYEWDPNHGGELEQYDGRGRHLGVVDPKTGKYVKPAKPGRTTPT